MVIGALVVAIVVNYLFLFMVGELEYVSLVDMAE